jgi:hypothetical protein
MKSKDELAAKIDKIMEKGSTGEIIAELSKLDLPNPSNNVHANGGKGGRAISLTYVDNYSSLMLVYTFLLNTLEREGDEGSFYLNKSLLTVLQQSMEEQQQYRAAFLEAVNLLNDQKE